MNVEWTYDILIYTAVILALSVLFISWSKNGLARLGILVGVTGLWLMIIQPEFSENRQKQTTPVSDIQSFLASNSAAITDSVVLEGFNHHVEDILLLEPYKVGESVHNELEEGFYDVNYPQKVKVGEEFRVTGSIIQKDSIKVNVSLVSPSNEVYESSISDRNQFDFTVAVPAEGKFEYLLRLISETDTISEMIPIIADKSEKLQMLIYSSTPRFELNYLKNYWVSEGHGVLQKVKISKDRFSTTSVNMKQESFNTLTWDFLKSLDIYILDVDLWNAISVGERNRMLKAVKELGKGLMLLPSNIGGVATSIPFQELSAREEKELGETMVSENIYRLSGSWKEDSEGWQASSGYGKIFLPRYDETYKLILSDHSPKYRDMWTNIFSTLYRNYATGFRVQSSPYILENESCEVNLIGVEQEDTIIFQDKAIPVIHTPFLEDFGSARLVPKSGWNKVLNTSNGSEAWFYAHTQDAWKTARQLKVRSQIRRLKHLPRDEQTSTYQESVPLSWWIPLTIMLVGFGLAWLSEKLDLTFTN